ARHATLSRLAGHRSPSRDRSRIQSVGSGAARRFAGTRQRVQHEGQRRDGDPAMTLTHRVIVCLDVTGNRVVKGVKFESLRDVGDPAELATRYELEGADEIVFLDVSATRDARALLLDSVRRTAEQLFIPLAVGGGVRTVTDASTALRAGADKVAVNSAASERPALID